MCSFPASGSSWKSFAREGVAVDDPGCRQRVTLSERGELVPKEPTPAIPPRQPFLPNPHDLIGVPAYSSKVARYAVVGIVAPHHRAQMGALVRDRLMPVAPAPVRNRRQRAGVTVLCRYLPHHFLACPRLAPDVGEAEEGERGTIRLQMVSPICRLLRKSTKRVLSGWSVSPYRARRLPKTPRTPLGIEEVLERQHGIVSEADKGTSPRETWAHLGLKPFVQHVVQEKCSRGRVRSHRLVGSLRSRGAGGPPPGLLLSATYQSSVDHTIRDSLVKKVSKVGVRNRSILRMSISSTQRSPLAHAGSNAETVCLMSRATRPEAVRTGKEVLLIHRLQHHDDCSLRQLSSKVGMPSGRREPSAFGMYVLRTGGANVATRT